MATVVSNFGARVLGALGGLALLVAIMPVNSDTQLFIVQGKDMATVKAAVLNAGGRITHELGVIRGVSARLTPGQIENLRADGRFRLHRDGSVKAQGAGF